MDGSSLPQRIDASPKRAQGGNGVIELALLLLACERTEVPEIELRQRRLQGTDPDADEVDGGTWLPELLGQPDGGRSNGFGIIGRVGERRLSRERREIMMAQFACDRRAGDMLALEVAAESDGLVFERCYGDILGKRGFV